MTRSHPSRSGDSSRSKPPDRFPEPNVPGGYGGPQGYSTYTPNQQPEQQPPSGYGYPQPPPHPYQLPVPQTNPVGGHAGAISRVHGPQPKTGCVNHHTRPSPPAFPHAFPDPRAPDRAHPPSYPFGAPGRPSVPEQLPYPPVQSWSYGASPPYETDFSHTSGSRSQVGPPDYRPLDSPSPNNVVSRNPPSWPSPTPVQSPAQLPYDAGHGYQTYQPPETVRSYGLRVGQRKAVLVGINYATHPDPRFRLRWGVHDAREMARFLRKHFGFERNNIRVLTDDQHDRPWDLPTEANIRAAMSWLVEGAQPGDSLFFYFSGHATQAKDTNRDERDGRDECMCAMDYMGSAQFPISPTTPGIIVDDDINSIMVQPLQQGCRLTAVLDCCHSGTLLDLPFIYDSHGGLKSLDDLSIVEQKSSSADVISLSACKDSENAYEVLAEGGALRKAFIEYMTNWGNNGSCFDVIRSLLAYMSENGVKNGVWQRPQLSSSHWIDTNQRFTII